MIRTGSGSLGSDGISLWETFADNNSPPNKSPILGDEKEGSAPDDDESGVVAVFEITYELTGTFVERRIQGGIHTAQSE